MIRVNGRVADADKAAFIINSGESEILQFGFETKSRSFF